MSRNWIWSSVSLPTKIVVFCLAIVFVAANMRSRPFLIGHSVEPEDKVTFSYTWADCMGWPLHYYRSELHQVYPVKHARRVAEGYSSPFVIPADGEEERGFRDLSWARYLLPRSTWLWPTVALAVNALVGLATIVALATACEMLFRRICRRGAPRNDGATTEGGQ